LPPVKRLETLETLLVHTSSKVKFEDIESSDDLKTLLFGTSIRYNERVRTVINMFKRIYEPYYRRVKNEYV
jgi:alpha-glucuronidase